MNRYRIQSILDFIHRQGPRPTDAQRLMLGEDDPLALFGLDRVLTAEEQHFVERELSAVIHAQATMDRIRIDQTRV